jgi:gluconolactonase
LTTIATSESDPIFHEAVTWYPATEEVFFVQNAGAPAAGTGLNKSSIIQKIKLSDAEKVRNGTLEAVPVTVVNTSNPQVINPNGGTNWKGNIIFAGEGQGDNVPSALYVMNPLPPYNTTSKHLKCNSRVQHDTDHHSSCEQLLWSPVQLAQRLGR